MKAKLFYLIPITLGAICFIIGLIDVQYTDAQSYKEMTAIGRVAFVGFMTCLGFLAGFSLYGPVVNLIKKLFK